MRMISCHSGKLQELAEAGLKTCADRTFRTGLDALDALAPSASLARGAVHEILTDPKDGQTKFFAAILARAAIDSSRTTGFQPVLATHARAGCPCYGENSLPSIWSDPKHELYPPALVNLGFDLSRVFLLHPKTSADEMWAIAESLRCKGVGAVVAAPKRLTRIEARRLQLAAETGGSVAILLRHTGSDSNIYAAATRWLVSPAPGERTVMRWKIQLLHGHGGRIGQSVYLEFCRETNHVRALEKLADRQAPPQTARAIA